LAQLAACSQTVRLELAVLDRLARYRQHRFWEREAGGQLFGRVNDEEVVVEHATGPYRGDSRSRFRYRSDPAAANLAIVEMAGRGYLYVGEWHTHPEPTPRASAEDLASFTTLNRRSKLRLAATLLVIQGTEHGVSGLTLYSYGSEGLSTWELSTDFSANPSSAG